MLFAGIDFPFSYAIDFLTIWLSTWETQPICILLCMGTWLHRTCLQYSLGLHAHTWETDLMI